VGEGRTCRECGKSWLKSSWGSRGISTSRRRENLQGVRQELVRDLDLSGEQKNEHK
jgi:hypothetical protein